MLKFWSAINCLVMHQTKKNTVTVFLSIPLNKLPCLKNSPKNLLPSIVESQTENYRELLPHLLLGVKIKEPLELQNLTVSFFHFLLFRTVVSVCV